MYKHKTKTPHVFAVLFFLSTSLLALESCSRNDDLPPEISPPTSGFWKSDTTGYVLELKDNGDINLHGTSSEGCVTIQENFDPVQFANLSLTSVSPTQMVASSPLLTGDISFRLLDSEAAECAASDLIFSTDSLVNYRHFWSTFNEYYSGFEIKDIDWSIYETPDAGVTQENLYQLIEQAITPLDDGHVSVIHENGFISSNEGTLVTRLNEFLDTTQQGGSLDDFNSLLEQKEEILISQYADADIGVGSDPNERLFYGLITPEIGYINITSMGGYSNDPSTELEAVDAIMSEVLGAIEQFQVSKLIIDIRFNSGGFDGVALAIASRFFDQERLVFTKKTRMGDGYSDEATISVQPNSNGSITKDIVLLTSPYTVSAGEIFTLAMKTLPYVTLVGQPTQGAFSDILSHRLPNGSQINLSNQIYEDPQGINYEGIGIGIAPENEVPFFTSSDFDNNIDSGIDRALELLDN